MRFLLVPGWLNSGSDHWQGRWESLHGYERVEPDDWEWPRRGDWTARLDETLLADTRPAVLVAHSLGCQLVAACAAHSRLMAQVRAALLVAPPDTQRADMPPQLFNWKPILRTRLPFPALAVTSSDDPCCDPARAAAMLPAGAPSASRSARARPRQRRIGSGRLARGQRAAAGAAGTRGLTELRADRRQSPPMVTKKPKGLGMGLEALLGPRARDEGAAPAAESGAPSVLRLDLLQPGRYQPRTRMDEGSLFELAESIKAQGVMQPVLVRPIGAGRYEIIAGERRMRAARLAGLDEVPVLVKDVPDESAAAMALIENIQREDLNPLEEAQGLRRLTEEFGLTHEQAAQAVGRSRSTASNLLRLLQLTEPVQQMLMAGDLDMGHARALLPLDGAQQILAAGEIVARKLSVREAERRVAQQLHPRQRALLRVPSEKSRDIARIEEELSDALTATVEIRIRKRTKRGEQGEVSIAFGSLDELNGLLDKLGIGAR